MTLPTSPGKIIALVCWAAAVAKLAGLVAVKFAATDLLLLGLLTVAVIP
jgi:uncharacterized membrane protein